MTVPDGDRKRRWLFRARIWVGLALGLLALYLAARAVDVGRLREVLLGVRLPLVLLTLLSSLVTPVVKAARWRWLFRPERPRLRLDQLTSLIIIGQAVNFVIPGRWGELVRTYLTGEEAQISKWFVLGTIAAEKLLDLVVLAVLVVVLLPFVALPAGLAARIDAVVLTALGVTFGAVALLGGRSFWMKLAERILRRLPSTLAERWRRRIASGLDGLAVLGDRRAALAVWAWTLVFWAVACFTNFLLLLAFDLPPSILMALVVLAMLQGGVAVPSTPGKIGVFQLLCMLSLGAFGVSEAIGLAYGLVLYVLVIGGVTVWAAIALWRRSWNWRRLAEASAAW